MACSVRVNRHGYLAYRLYWNGIESNERVAGINALFTKSDIYRPLSRTSQFYAM